MRSQIFSSLYALIAAHPRAALGISLAKSHFVRLHRNFLAYCRMPRNSCAIMTKACLKIKKMPDFCPKTVKFKEKAQSNRRLTRLFDAEDDCFGAKRRRLRFFKQALILCEQALILKIVGAAVLAPNLGYFGVCIPEPIIWTVCAVIVLANYFVFTRKSTYRLVINWHSASYSVTYSCFPIAPYCP